MSKITRQKRTDNFTVVNNDVIQDKTLSWAAKGMLIYLLHLPDNWQINVADLANRSKNGRDGTAAIIKELMAAGYISRVKIKNEKAQFKGYDYTVTDKPENGKAVNGLSVNGSSENGESVTSKNYSYKELNVLKTNKVKNVESDSTPLLHEDEIEDIEQQIYASKATQKKERKNVAPKKKENPTPTRPMFQYYEQKYAELNQGEKPIWQDKYAPALKKLHEVLTARCAQKEIVQLDPLQPWKDFIDMWSQYLVDHPKETWHRDNFNPMTLYSQFNSIIAKLNAQPAKVQSDRMDKWEKWAIDNGIKQTV